MNIRFIKGKVYKMAYPQNLPIEESSIKTILLDYIYPVGSIYMSVNSTSPTTFLGGTWVQLKDSFLLGCGDTYSNNTTGGSSSHTHTTGNHTLTSSEIPSHYHSYTKATSVNNTTLTIDQIPSHRHGSSSQAHGWSSNNSDVNSYVTYVNSGSPSNNSGGTGEGVVKTSYIGGGKAHNHGLSTESANTGSTGSGKAHSHGNTGSSSNLPPYLTVYMWKRTA